MAFDISGLQAGQTVTQATSRLYLVNAWDYPYTARTMTSYRATSGWSEMAVTWNNKPGYGEAYGSVSILTEGWGWHEFDVTNLVKAWYAGTQTNHGVVVRGPEHSGPDSSWRMFSTKEGASPLELVVEYGGTSNKVYLPLVARNWYPNLPFIDNFSVPGSGWPVKDYEDSRIGYVGGEYQLLLKTTSWEHWVTPDLLLPSDYGIEADCRQATAMSGSCALAFDRCRSSGSHEMHLFRIYPDDQDYLFERRNMDGSGTLLIGWTYNSAIRSGQQTNRLRVERVGTQLSFYVNDTVRRVRSRRTSDHQLDRGSRQAATNGSPGLTGSPCAHPVRSSLGTLIRRPLRAASSPSW